MSGAAWGFAVGAGVFFFLWLMACATASRWRETSLKAESRLRECQHVLPKLQPTIDDRKTALRLVSTFETAVCEQERQAQRLGDSRGSEERRRVNDARQAILDRMRPMELEEEDNDDGE